jgi:hypothetical protein
MFNYWTQKSSGALSCSFWFSSGYDIPWAYLQSGLCRLFYYKNRTIGGYAIISTNKKRSIMQIPEWRTMPVANYYMRRASEITAYFIDLKEHSWYLLAYYFFDIMLHKSKYFVYSYELENKKLEKLYSAGKPKRIYSGIVNNLEGMEGIHFENVEVITKLGFLRLFINRIFRRNIKWKSR